MMNMAYCRFHNTVEALKECYEHMDDELSPSEEVARRKLIRLCAKILADSEENGD